jgi:hypothetical protein
VRQSSQIRALLSFTTSLSLILPLTAQAQDAGSPPSRVGQIAYISGQVSFNGSGSGGWAQAALNYPVAVGDSLYTQDGAQAVIALNASKISLNSDTELQITQLDDSAMAATASQGETYFAIDDLEPGQTFAISTPRGTVTISQDGQYDVIAGDANTPTIITALSGAASVTAPGVAVQVQPGQEAVLSGDSQTTAQLGQAQPDEFARHLYAQNTAPPPSYAPPIVGQMTGAYELSDYGAWDQDPQYGAVWYPRVDDGWAPYREGHWAFIAPWGWTWVDNEPWGFAPFHYGRWIDDGGRWGWVPAGAYQEGGDYGSYYQPVYAPAVVSFFGLAAGAAITAAILSSGSIGWVPLGPGEAFHPYYHASPAYVRRINIVNVRNFNEINEHNTINYNNFANRRGATFVPSSAMSHGENVARYNHMPASSELASARQIDPGTSNLPRAAGPLAAERPGTAPHPTEFAERHEIPPATMSHSPIENGANGGVRTFEPTHPGFSGTNPGYRPPPPPPGSGEHMIGVQGQEFHPQTENRPQQSQSFHPEESGQHPEQPQIYRPQESQQFHPQEMQRPEPTQAYHPPEQQFHPQEMQRPEQPQVYRPQQAQEFHPQEIQRPEQTQAYHPPEQQFHPQEMQRPQEIQRPPMQHMDAPHPEAPRPQPHDDNHKPQ